MVIPFFYRCDMKLILYKMTDDNNVIGKNLGVGLEIDITLRRGFDRNFPTILLNSLVGVDFNYYNYCYIEVINAYYFINECELIGAGVYSLDLEIDVLESYKTDILNSHARVKRGIKTGDYYNGSIDKSVIQNIEVYNSNTLTIANPNSGIAILTVIGG